ncbi:hypothetical protein ABG067_004893 [Albugo candida]
MADTMTKSTSNVSVPVQTLSFNAPHRVIQVKPTRMNVIRTPATKTNTRALGRLGVDIELLEKEKGMKKLGVCDLDIFREKELRKLTGMYRRKKTTKPEFVFGFTCEQMVRDKAIRLLGTSEHEVFEDIARRVSTLGLQEDFSPNQKL